MSSIAANLRLSRRSRSAVRLRRPPRTLAFLALGLVALAALYHFYIRDSAIVGVSHVKVEGIDRTAPGASRLQAQLEEAAKSMTTLHVRPEVLEQAVAGNPLVESVSAKASFPHSMTVTIVERHPAGILGDGSDAVVMASDGVKLTGIDAGALKLPSISPEHAKDVAKVLGAAPHGFVRYTESGNYSADDGIVVELTNGIDLLFGNSDQAAEKWKSAASVLADPDLTALDYVDLTAPTRPAVGGTGIPLASAP